MQGTFVVALASSMLVFGCGTESSSSEPIPVQAAHEASGGPAPSIGDWLPEGHPRRAGSGPAVHGDTLPPGHPPVEGYGEPAPEAGAPPPDAISGTVRETMNAATYTYMRLETEDGMVWIAATQTPVSVGDRVVAAGSVMQNFRSNTLDRTFDQLVLASYVRVDPAAAR